MQFGGEIQVDGVRPHWLADGVVVKWDHDYGFRYATKVENLNWAGTYSQPRRVTHIRLPADHFAYQAIAAGFEPWAGGDVAPEDWDGYAALREDGSAIYAPFMFSGWRRGSHMHNIIGYRKKATAQPATSDDFHAEALRALQDATRRIAELSAPPADDRLTIRITGPQASGKTRWAGLLEKLAATLATAGFPVPVILDDGEGL